MDLPAKITEEEVVRAVRSMGLSKSPGPSGLGCAGESSSRCRASRRPLRRPSTRSSARPRGGDTGPCTSSAWSSPKDETGSKYRPVAISETIMMAFHKIVLSRLRTQTLAFLETEQMHSTECTWVVSAWHTEMQVDGTQEVSLGITNAFNSIPREEILRGLDQAGVPLILRNYIEAFLQLRHAAHLDSVPRG